ncbi:MAG: 7-carboxy-7-deazaguanine synthase QueE [Deltaproteobacteria bacterium]|nr:7-carboxy-7-deazaguanine synthase QueE [Deltaproteobacteria bacterium]
MSGTANLVEMFSSIQGEGPFAGLSTLFIRFGGCDLRCSWCDTPHTWRPAAQARIETARGGGEFAVRANPLPVAQIVAAAESLGAARHRQVSLTGGEPLLQPEAIAEVARALHGRGPQILLETHGLHADSLERALAWIDVVSMDWKLASDVRREGAPTTAPREQFHDAHERFLAVAKRAPHVVVKLVITRASEDAEIEEALARIARTHPAACVVLQPVTPTGAVKDGVASARMLALGRRAEELLREVRVMPQLHPVMGVR